MTDLIQRFLHMHTSFLQKKARKLNELKLWAGNHVFTKLTSILTEGGMLMACERHKG